jgi:hypothetical protein
LATPDAGPSPLGGHFHPEEAKFMLLWTLSEDGATMKEMSQLQHNLWVAYAKTAALSVITGGGKWVECSSLGQAVKTVRLLLKNLPKSVEDYLDTLRVQGLLATVKAIEPFDQFI